MHITTDSIFMLESGISMKPRLTRRSEKLTKPRDTRATENHSSALGTSLSFSDPKPRFSATAPMTSIPRARAYRIMTEPPGGLPDDTLVGAFY